MDLIFSEESFIIRGVVFDIYKQFRNNHKEKVYHNSLLIGLSGRGLSVEKDKRLDVFFQGKKVGIYMPDLIVNGKIIIELKAKPKLATEDIKQFRYYLKGSNYKLGFLINFGANDGVEIVRRVYEIARKN